MLKRSEGIVAGEELICLVVWKVDLQWHKEKTYGISVCVRISQKKCLVVVKVEDLVAVFYFQVKPVSPPEM